MQATRRAAALDALQAIPATEDETTDRRLRAEWDAAAPLLDSCREADALKARAASARARVGLVDHLKEVIGRADQGLATEQQVLDAAGPPLPANYVHAHLPRVQTARLRLNSALGLLDALKATPQSDLQIAAAWEKLKEAGSEPKDRATLDRCRLALRRRDLLQRLASIPKTTPIDEQDARWLGEWKETLLSDCADARAYRPRRDEARERKAAWEALEDALRSGNVPELKRLKDLPLLARHPGLEKRRTEIAEKVRASERVDQLVRTLKANDPAAFLKLIDLNLLAEYAPAFTPYRRLIESFIDVHVLNTTPLSAGQPVATIGEGGRHVTARWTWKNAALIQTCRVATDPGRFLDRPENARDGTFKVTVDQHRMAQGYVLSARPDWRKLYVTVWPVVDLGWTERIGPALCLGPIALDATPAKPSRNGGTSLLQGLLEKMLNW